MIIGKEIFLRLMEEYDIPFKVKWVNDEEIRNLIISDYISEAKTKQWFNDLNFNSTRKEFMICLKKTNEAIGFTSLKNIDLFNSKAELSMLIGHKTLWNKGYGREAKKLIINYAFNEMGLNKLYTHNWSENKRIIDLNKKMGFKIDGVLRSDIYFKGEFRDIVVMSILRSDWIKLNNINNSHNE